MNNIQQTNQLGKPFWQNGHFFRDIALVLIFIQIVLEYQVVIKGLDIITYPTILIAMNTNDMLPFVFKMGWCFILILMFVFTLGGVSRWPLTIQFFITLVLIGQDIVNKDYLWVAIFSLCLVIYYFAIREARKREIQMYLAEILPSENETPLWVIVLAFIILNTMFTLPAYEKYIKNLANKQQEYDNMFSGFFGMNQFANNINQSANNISNTIKNSEVIRMLEYYMRQFSGKGPKIEMTQQNP